MGFSLSSVLMRMGWRSASIEAPIDAITLFVLLICSCIVIGHLLETNRWITESITALVIVSFAGFLFITFSFRYDFDKVNHL